MTKLPRTSKGLEAIWGIVDRLSKSVQFLPIKERCSIERVFREKRLAGEEIVQLTADKIDQIREWLKIAQDRQKSYVDKCYILIKFQVRKTVTLKVSLWKRIAHFGKRSKLSMRYIGLL